MSKVLGKGVTAVGLDVGFLCQSPPSGVGGIETHTRELARGLAARGHRVHVLALERGSDGAPHSVQTGRDANGLELRCMVPAASHQGLADLVQDDRADDVVLAWLAETPCDLIHVHHLTGFGAGALRAIADMGRPLVVTLHDAWLFCPCGQPQHALDEAGALEACAARHWPMLLPSGGGSKQGPEEQGLADDAQAVELRREFALRCLELAHRIWVPSQAALETCAAAGVERARMQVVEPGLDVQALAQAAKGERAGLEPSARVRLGVLGSVLPGKGVVELLEAVAEADIDELEVHVHGPLVPFHGDEAYLLRARELEAQLPRVQLHGAYAPDDLPGLLAGLDGVAAPSLWPEFHGLGVREARAAGLPVLVSDRGGLPPAAADGAAGLVVAAEDRAAWVRALTQFATDSEARSRWAAEPAGVRTREDMTLDVERRYVELVHEVTGRVPDLEHVVEGFEPPAAPATQAPKKKGLFGRLFGG